MTTISEEQPDPIKAANRMTDALSDFSAELKKLSARDRRSRLYLRILAVSFFIDICLTVVTSFVAIQTDHNSHAIHQSQLAACRTANSQRDNERAIWDYVLGSFLTPSPGETAAQEAKTRTFVDGIEKKVAVTFQDRDCAKVYQLP